MKYFLLPFALLCMSLLPANAQVAHDLTVYDEGGAPFTLLVNGQAINSEPLSSVTAKDLQVGFARVEVRFADEAIPAIERKNLQIATPGTATSGPVAVVYVVKEKKGTRVLRFASRTPKQVQAQPVIIINNR